MNKPKVNRELFEDEFPNDLESKTYYAYVDSIEKIYGTTNIRFDCIEKNIADKIQIDKESIVGLPSIIIDVSGSNQIIDSLFGIKGVFSIFNYESKWVVLNTTFDKTNLKISEFFNFSKIGTEKTINKYSIDSIKTEKNFDNLSHSKVQEIKNATKLIESPKDIILNFINQIRLHSFSHVNVYNVGQGNCNALVDEKNVPLLYFDVGGGCVANKSTYPENFKLCHSLNPSVILSHWDLDHFVTAVYDNELLQTKWLVPVQYNLSNTAMQIASALERNGNLICWNDSLDNEILLNNHIITKCGNRSSLKNNSGLALYVNYGNDRFTLLPGDATFACIPNINNKELIGLVASHHGAKSSIRGVPNGLTPSMLAYSYGVNNTYGHAHQYAREMYINNNWGESLDTFNGNIAMLQNPIDTNVPCESRVCSLSVIQHF